MTISKRIARYQALHGLRQEIGGVSDQLVALEKHLEPRFWRFSCMGRGHIKTAPFAELSRGARCDCGALMIRRHLEEKL